MSKLYLTFQSPYGLHKPPQTRLFHTTFLSDFVIKYPKTFSYFWIFQYRNSSLTKTTDSCSFLLKAFLIVVNLSNITLSLNHSNMYVCWWQRNQPARNKLLPLIKAFLLLLTKSPNARNFCLSLCFLSFFCFVFFIFFWPIETTTPNLRGLTNSNPSKSSNLVTISNEHMNHLFWA